MFPGAVARANPGQFEGRVWRMSHPLVSAYRAGAEVANERATWHKRLATLPPVFSTSECL